MSYQPPPSSEEPTQEPIQPPPQYTPPPQQPTQVNVAPRKRSPLPFILGGVGALLVLCVVCVAAAVVIGVNTANRGIPTAVAFVTLPTTGPTERAEVAPTAVEAEPTDTSSPPTRRPTSLPTRTEVAAAPTEPAASEPTVATTEPTAAGENSPYEIGEPIARKSEFVDLITVVGVIKYKGAEPRSNARVSVTLTDAAGKVLATTSAIGAPMLIKPNSNIPYKALFSEAPAYEKIEINVSTDEVGGFASAFFYTDLEVVDASLQKGGAGGAVRVVGRVKNIGEKGTNLVSVSAVLYGADGKVLDVSSGIANITGTLAPGQDSPFSVDFFGVEGAETFETNAWGTPAP